MPLSKQPRYYPSKGAYYCTRDGDRLLLARGPEGDPVTYEAAFQELSRLRREYAGHCAPDPRLPVADVLARYAAHLRRTRPASNNLENKVTCLASFADFAGGLPFASLSPDHVRAWLELRSAPRPHPTTGQMIRYGDGARNVNTGTLITALNWALRERVVSHNPLARMERPTLHSRARKLEDLVSEDAYRKLLGRANPRTRDLLVALRETGARPSEVFRARAADYLPARGLVFVPVHKNVRRGKDRFLHVSPALAEVLGRLCAGRPAGPLFVNSRGGPWGGYALGLWMSRAAKELGLPGRLTPYSFRHTFATDWLMAGGSAQTLSEVMGTSVRVIERHYAHLGFFRDKVHQEFLRVRCGQSNP